MSFITQKPQTPVGRPAKYGRLPLSYTDLSPMDMDEVQHRINYSKNANHWIGYPSHSINDIAACEAKKPALISFASKLIDNGVSPSMYSPDGENFIMVCFEDIQLFLNIPVTSIPQTITPASTSQSTRSTAPAIEALKPKPSFFDGTDVEYDPRMDENSPLFESNTSLYFDYKKDFGNVHMWRIMVTNEPAKIPETSEYSYLNATCPENYTQINIERIVSNLPGDSE